jgi:hypothetical protein
VHVAKLRAVAFIKNKNNMTSKYSMPFVAADEPVEFLNRGDNNARVGILKLAF